MITEAVAEWLGLVVSRCPFNVQLTLADCSKASRLITHWTHDVALSALNQSLVTLPTLYVVPSVPGGCDVLLSRPDLLSHNGLDAYLSDEQC